ncbi:MAG TPA: beta galactosidase jelly roll domain-containing protein, partial [Opitutus sp.]|nr:beta galactosidase jelly roll domain-containing protein [Opitutus sp.]
MPRLLCAFLFSTLCVVIPHALAETAPINVQARAGLTLNGKWSTIVDPYLNGYYNYRLQEHPNGYFMDRQQQDKSELLEYNFDQSPTLTVPGDWNSQEEKLLYYEGAIWYRRKFDYRPAAGDSRLFVHFGAANYQADVYLNGKKVGRHVGGFTPFAFEVTGNVKPT